MARSELLQSHDELRAVLRLAGMEIRKLNFGREDTPLLQLMRRVLREARVVAKAERERPARNPEVFRGFGEFQNLILGQTIRDTSPTFTGPWQNRPEIHAF